MDTDKETPAAPPSGGTILLVEDDENVRRMAAQMLKILGYTVFAPLSPQDAIAICKEADQPIDCVVTDVIMPGMSGRELVEAIRILRPGIKVLFMSGYTSDVIAHHGVLDEGVPFIQKPFDMSAIHKKIQEIIAAPRAS
jgi:two-component system cell cycle sensor histidine kinase/response regulator CckA